jgi:hypothetical protein
MADAASARSRGPLLTVLAGLLGLLSLSNFSKPLGQAMRPESDAGFVFLGQRLEGAANTVMGPLFGLLLAVYAYGVWTQRRWVVPLAIAYAAYVVANLVLFAARAPKAQVPGLGFMVVYAAVAIGVSAGGALYLYRNRHRLS